MGVFERVFEVGPVFRAEPHDTVRHLAQYTSLDAELGFITDHRDVMAVLRDTVAGMVRRSAAGRFSRGALALTLPQVPAEIPDVHFTDALELIAGSPARTRAASPTSRPPTSGGWVSGRVREHGSRVPVRRPATRWRSGRSTPTPTRPGRRYSNGFDLLFRGIELVTGGQRLHRHEDYLAALAARGEDPAPYAGYLQVFEHGMPPHGGFAIGLERWTARLTGAANVRQVTLFPRDLHRLSP